MPTPGGMNRRPGRPCRGSRRRCSRSARFRPTAGRWRSPGAVAQGGLRTSPFGPSGWGAGWIAACGRGGRGRPRRRGRRGGQGRRRGRSWRQVAAAAGGAGGSGRASRCDPRPAAAGCGGIKDGMIGFRRAGGSIGGMLQDRRLRRQHGEHRRRGPRAETAAGSMIVRPASAPSAYALRSLASSGPKGQASLAAISWPDGANRRVRGGPPCGVRGRRGPQTLTDGASRLCSALFRGRDSSLSR